MTLRALRRAEGLQEVAGEQAAVAEHEVLVLVDVDVDDEVEFLADVVARLVDFVFI